MEKKLSLLNKVLSNVLSASSAQVPNCPGTYVSKYLSVQMQGT